VPEFYHKYETRLIRRPALTVISQ